MPPDLEKNAGVGAHQPVRKRRAEQRAEGLRGGVAGGVAPAFERIERIEAPSELGVEIREVCPPLRAFEDRQQKTRAQPFFQTAVAEIVEQLIVGEQRRDTGGKSAGLPRVGHGTAAEGMGDTAARGRLLRFA